MKAIKKTLFVYNFILITVLIFQGIKQFKATSDLALLLLIIFPYLHFLSSIFKKYIKLHRLADILKVISLITTSVLFLIAAFGLIFRFEYIFILLILPLPLYFVLISFSKNKVQPQEKQIVANKKSKIENKMINVVSDEKVYKDESINDPLRRSFIKLLGGSGIGVLLMTLINPKKAEASFFGSVPGPGTVAIKDSSENKIDPAIKSPTDAYAVTEIDDASPSYYGFVNKDGEWYITREASDGSFRYNKGTGSFSTNWSGRTSLTYNYFDTTF